MRINTHTCNDCGTVWSRGHICPEFRTQRIIGLAIVATIAVVTNYMVWRKAKQEEEQ